MTLNIPVCNTFPSAEVVQPPKACAGDNVTFTCRVDALHASISWRINGTILSDLSLAVLDDIDLDTYELMIPAKPEYNTTEVQCVAIGSERNDNDSEVVHLYVG